jgi:hypothetical protein
VTVPDLWTAVHTRELHLHDRPAVAWPHWRNRFPWKPNADPDAVDTGAAAAGVVVLRSFTTLEPGQFTGPPGFDLHEGWSAPPFRMVWTCRQERSIVTFTEGDLVLCVAADDAAYTRLHAEHRAFYREH